MKRASDLVRVCWDAKSAEETLGPTNDALARGSNCWAFLPSTRVPEPHASWLRRARDAAREVVEDRDDSRKRKRRDDSPEKGPRPYRPPGAAARAALAGDQGVMLLRTVPAPIQKCFAEGLGKGALARAAQVVNLTGEENDRAHPLLRGEKGVVATRGIEAGCALPYAGVIATDYEIAVLLRRAPRAAARWLMYRYEFAKLDYLSALLGCKVWNCAEINSAPTFPRTGLLDGAKRTPHAVDCAHDDSHGLAGALHQLRQGPTRGSARQIAQGSANQPRTPKAKSERPREGHAGW